MTILPVFLLNKYNDQCHEEAVERFLLSMCRRQGGLQALPRLSICSGKGPNHHEADRDIDGQNEGEREGEQEGKKDRTERAKYFLCLSK